MLDAVVNGAILGAVYALFALGLNLVFAHLRVVFFAAGSVAMLCAYSVQILMAEKGLGFLLALVISVVLVLIGALVSYVVIFRFTVDRHEVGLTASLGFFILLDNLALNLWSSDLRRLPLPGAGEMGRFLGLAVPKDRAVAAGIGVLLVVAIFAFLTYSMPGRAIRAVVDQPVESALLGVRTSRITAGTFMLSMAVLGVAGVLYGGIFSVYPEMGLNPMLTGFIVMVIGGLGSIKGSLIAGVGLGVLTAVFQQAIGNGLIAASFGYVLLIVIVVTRPAGLFGEVSVASR